MTSSNLLCEICLLVLVPTSPTNTPPCDKQASSPIEPSGTFPCPGESLPTTLEFVAIPFAGLNAALVSRLGEFRQPIQAARIRASTFARHSAPPFRVRPFSQEPGTPSNLKQARQYDSQLLVSDSSLHRPLPRISQISFTHPKPRPSLGLSRKPANPDSPWADAGQERPKLGQGFESFSKASVCVTRDGLCYMIQSYPSRFRQQPHVLVLATKKWNKISGSRRAVCRL